jgi:hypothetical protein
LVDILFTIEVVAIIAFIPYMIWKHFGGWPEAWYRARGIPYFFAIIFQGDGTPIKSIHKDEIIESKSPAWFSYLEVKRSIDPDNAARSGTGRPLYYYTYDNMQPIPIFKWNDEKWGPKLNGALVQAAFKNNVIERMHSFGRKQPIPWFLMLAIMILAVAMVAINIYYAHDAVCAIKPAQC